MKVLLINPCIRQDTPKKMLNVGLAYVATAIYNAGFDLEIIDVDAHRYTEEQLEKIIRTKKFDAVGIGDLVSHYKWVKVISKVLKQYHPKVPIMVGNTCGTSIPELLLQKTDVDIAVISEADQTVVELLNFLEEGKPLDGCKGIAFKKDGVIKKNCGRPVIDPIDQIPFPNYDLFEMDVYLEASKWHTDASDLLKVPFDDIIAMPLVTARGCPFKCTFCFHAFQNKKYRYRSPENMVLEIESFKEKYGANFIAFWDELSFCHVPQVEKFVNLLLERNLNINWQGTCRSELFTEEDFDLLIKVKKSGCTSLSYSLENGNDEILKAMNKKNTVDDFILQSKLLYDVGIGRNTSVVFGYPQETEATIKETFDMLRSANIYPSVGFLQPMPGTPMYKLAIDEGYIKDEEAYLLKMGDRQDLRINMSKKLTEERMMAVITEELKKLNKDLNTGLDEESLIKTRVYRIARSESFVNSFGVAAKVREEEEQEQKISVVSTS